VKLAASGFPTRGKLPQTRRRLMDSQPIALTMGQQFEIERLSRLIDAETSVPALRHTAKRLLMAWHSQKAATDWVMRQQMGRPAAFAAPKPCSAPVDVL
jgi:hypothetical protein